MPQQPPVFQALTVKANHRATQIITDLTVYAAFDPKTMASGDPLPPGFATKAL